LGEITNIKRAKQGNSNNKPNASGILPNCTKAPQPDNQCHIQSCSSITGVYDNTYKQKTDIPTNHYNEIYDISVEEDLHTDVEMEKFDCEDKQEDDAEQEYNEILKIDAADMHDPQAVSEYIQDIMIYFKGVEEQGQPSPGYMDGQRDVNSKMREILVDWLSEVHLKFKLRPETMYLTVNLIDRFLSKRPVSRTKLQLVGCTAMLIASKYEEIYAPEVRDFVYISDKAYTREQILKMEAIVLNTLQFNLTVPSALRFGQRYLKLVPSADQKFKMLVQYLMELTLQNYAFLNYLPSMIATSAIYIALGIFLPSPGKPKWTNLLRSQTEYTEEDIEACVKELHQYASTKPEKYRAVRKKYSSKKFFQVANITVPPLVSII